MLNPNLNSNSTRECSANSAGSPKANTHFSAYRVHQDLAPLCTVDCSAVDTNESKLFTFIGISDLQQHPVWESILDDEADELSVFPVGLLPVADLEGRFMGTRVQLANGDLHWAMLFYLDANDTRKTEQFLSLRIERSGKWFDLARYGMLAISGVALKL